MNGGNMETGAAKTADARETKLPPEFIWAVAAICVLPITLNLLGVDFSTPKSVVDLGELIKNSPGKVTDAMFEKLSGAFIHTLLEWSAFLTAIFTVLLALTHYRISRDVTTPIIGLALFTAGAMDAFHTLAADRLIEAVADNRDLIPFTWAICRIFNALIMIAGVGMFLVRTGEERRCVNVPFAPPGQVAPPGQAAHPERRGGRGFRFVIMVSLIFGIIAYSIIHYSATHENLPNTMYPGSVITRPYDVIPLVLFVFAGLVVYPRFYRHAPSFFSHALIISAIPEVATQLHMAFGSTALFDNHFNIAHFLKIIAYAVPFGGLALDYVRTYEEQELSNTRLEKTRRALTEKNAALLNMMNEMERTEKQLRLSEEKNRAILDNAADGIITINEQGIVQSFNPAAERIFQYAAREVIDKNVSMLMPSPYHEEHDGYLKNYRDTGDKKIIGIGREVEGLRRDGTTFPLYLSVSETVLGKKRLYTGIVQDITKRKQAEEALRESEKRFRSVTQSANDAIISADSSGKIISWNKGAREIFGHTEEETLGEPLTLLIPERFRGAHLAGFNRYLSTGVAKVSGKTIKLNGLRRNGEEFPLEISISTWKTTEETFFTAIIRDITERKKAEEEIKKSHKAALAAREKAEVMALEAENANRAKSEFLSSMSHEIRTPMNAIIGMADLLSETSLTEEQEKYVNTYRYAGENLLNIINDILDLSKIESGHLVLERTGFDLQELIERTSEIMAIQAQEKGIELANMYSPDLPRILLGDPTRLRQVIINLAGNAIKFTEKGEVVIGVEARENGKDEVDLLFSVKDTGIGIPPEKLGTIFESFSQADSSTTRRFGGTGLGLSISKLIVELMGGKIWVESEEGKGSTFYFTAKLERDKRTGNGPEPAAIDLNGVRVLIVDDNETNRMILDKVLSGWGADTGEAVDGKNCLNELVNAKKSGRRYDLVLLDFLMPNMDGIEAAEKIKGDPEISVPIIIITSAIGAVQGRKRIEKSGIDAFMHKPVKQSELRTNINIVLGRAKRMETNIEKRRETAADTVPLKILLVEDNRDNRNLILAYLKKSQHGIEVAENGRIAVDKFSSGAYDLVLMDMQMPVMDGYDATRAIRQWEKENSAGTTPIVALTAHALKDDEIKSFEAGCDGHLTKPIKKKKLLEAINQYAARCTGGG